LVALAKNLDVRYRENARPRVRSDCFYVGHRHQRARLLPEYGGPNRIKKLEPSVLSGSDALPAAAIDRIIWR
jgi:hypothetical protein